MTGPYRDSLAAIKEKIIGLNKEITRKEERFTSTFWNEVAPGEGIGRPQKLIIPDEGDPPERYMQILASQESRLQCLEDTIANFNKIAAYWTEPEVEPIAFIRPSFRVIDELNALKPLNSEPSCEQEFRKIAQTLNPNIEVLQYHKMGHGCVYRVDNIPLTLCYSFETHGMGDGQVTHVNVVSTPIAKGMARQF